VGLLCHNLTCLIQEQETLGIVPVFWKDEDKELGPAVLPMVWPGSGKRATPMQLFEFALVWLAPVLLAALGLFFLLFYSRTANRGWLAGAVVSFIAAIVIFVIS
jgi:hypothetical protein